MRLLYLKLVNFIGIYNGMGINTIEIDFSKCTHNITIIHGINGSGKSTLFNALNPFSDPSDALIPNSEASKEIHYLMDNGDIIKIQYKYENKKIRKSSCHVYKVDPSGEVDLVPNGNIKDAKEMISTIFDFDPNFLGLSQLSSTNRGLADMRPADRKKFITSIMENLAAYNEIYKKLMKKSNALKSMITNINNKISSIGNTDQIQNHISTLEDQLGSSEDRKNLLIAQIADIKAKVGNIDINSTITEMRKYQDSLDKLPKVIIKIDDEYNDESYENDKKIIIESNSNISSIKNSIDILNKIITDDRDKIQTYNIKLNSISNQDTIDSYIKYREKYCNDLQEFIDDFNKEKFTAYDYISEDEIKRLYESVNRMSELEYRWSPNNPNGYGDWIKYVLDNMETTDFSEKKDIESLKYYLKTINIKIKNQNIVSELKCDESIRKICPLVKEFIGDESIDRLKEEKDKLEKEIEISRNFGQYRSVYLSIKDDMKLYYQQYQINKDIFDKIKMYNIKFDPYNLISNRIPYMSNIKRCKDLIDYIDQYNEIKKSIKEIDEKIEKMKNQSSDSSYLVELVSDLNDRVGQNTNKRNELNEYLNEFINKRDSALDRVNSYSAYKNKKDLEDKINSLKSNYDLASSVDKEVNTKMEELKNLNMNIIPHIQDEIAKCKYQLVLYEEYVKDYKEFTNKFNMVELFKKYSSPTTGIQTVFMQMYMNDIIDISNRLLGMLFNGEYVLYPFVINETEFRIPCCGNGLMNDDISSMSASQIAMISMIISFALLHKSSSTYNIVKLDEVDGALDTNNRMQFIVLLQKMMDMLRYNQCIMISHNSEINTANVDLILLKHDSNEELTGNIVYDYNREY